jgi:cell wall-associated NlpC family hydrolase
LARRLVVTGAAVWFVRWLASPIDDTADAAETPQLREARDEWEFPEPRRETVDGRSLRRRFATSLVFTALFFAGAALAAGAGNLTVSEDSTVVTATDTTATTTDASATDATADPAAAASATTDDVATEAAAPIATTADDPVVTVAPVTTADPTDTGDATAAPSPDSPPATDPSDVTVKASVPVNSNATPAAKPGAHSKPHAMRHVSTPVRHANARHLQNLPLVIPYHAIVFNPQAWLNDNPGTPTGQAAVTLAMNYLGVPYRWGGAVPMTGFDCSGLTRFVYAQLGINLVHYAASQFASFPKLDPAQLAPGDLVFFEPKADGPGHVAMYIGHDQIIEAPHTGAVVRISSFSGAAAAMGFLGAVRPYAATAAAPSRSLALASTIKWGPAPAFLRVQ